jgi:hypothetical protein
MTMIGPGTIELATWIRGGAGAEILAPGELRQACGQPVAPRQPQYGHGDSARGAR